MEFNLSDIHTLSSATKAFVSGDQKLKDLFGDKHPFYSIEEAINGKKNFDREKRAVLVSELKRQYLGIIGPDQAASLVNANIESLALPNTFTVTTGQQLHLFYGPAFVIYKILATIKAAEQYRTLWPEYNFVPVYWLASEDHDFEEIRNTKVFQHNFSWETRQGGATGRFHVREVGAIIDEIRSKLSLNEDNLKLLSQFEEIYNSSGTLSEATIRITHLLFAQYGLVCIDADNKALKTLFIPQIKDEISRRQSIVKFNEFSSELEKNGFSIQLKGREINLFYLLEDKRSRITEENGHFHIVDSDITFTRDEITRDIEENPQNYSPNAVLRPVYQEAVLPNICYIGGNAEVNYWLQLKDVFALYGINPAHLALRPSLWITPLKISKWLEKQSIDELALFRAENTKDLLKLLDSSGDDPGLKMQEFINLRQEIQDVYAKEGTAHLKELVEQGKSYEKLLKKLENELSEKRISKLDSDFKKLENIKADFYDLHHLQERRTSSLEMLIKYTSLEKFIYNSLEFKPSSGKIFIL